MTIPMQMLFNTFMVSGQLAAGRWCRQRVRLALPLKMAYTEAIYPFVNCVGQNLRWLLIHSLPRLKAKAEEAAQRLVSRGPDTLWMLTALCLSPGHTLPADFWPPGKSLQR